MCLFYIFKKDILDYVNIFQKVEKRFCEKLKTNPTFILCGDLNYDCVENIFPEIMKNCKDVIDIPTRKKKQLDHVIVSNQISVKSKKMIENNFDHKLCIIEI